MSKSTNEKIRPGEPAVLQFQARLVQIPDKGKSESPLLFNLPKNISNKVSGMTTIEGIINGHPFRGTLDRQTSGEHAVRVNAAMRRGANARAGDIVRLEILGPEPKPVMPNDLRLAIANADEAKTLWKDLTEIARRDYLRWIDGAKTPETRARRVRRTVEQLSEGKRRPCCFNAYEFMLARVKK